jgi:hypothetical protein
MIYTLHGNGNLGRYRRPNLPHCWSPHYFDTERDERLHYSRGKNDCVEGL